MEGIGIEQLNRQNRMIASFKCYEGANDRLRQRKMKKWTELDKEVTEAF